MNTRRMNSVLRSAALAALAVLAPLGAAVDYATDIKPILDAHCIACHGGQPGKKPKGGLRLDTPSMIAKGGKGGVVVVAGDPAKSSLLRLVSLPAGDADIMPPDPKPRLSQAQIDKIRDWIAAGAPGLTAAAATAAPVKPAVQPSAVQGAYLAPPADAPTDMDVLAGGVTAPDAAAIDLLRKVGARIVPISRNGALLDVELTHLGMTLTSEHRDAVLRLAGNIAVLDLSGTSTADAGLAMVSRMPNLTRLHLARTAVTDAGLTQLAANTRLAFLNLTGTAITDAGMTALAALPALRQVHLWGTQVTPAGIANLRTVRSGMVAELGSDLPAPPVASAGGKRR